MTGISPLVGQLSILTASGEVGIPAVTSERMLYLDNTMGAAFIGTVIAGMLHGVSCVQAWYYFTHQKDNWWTKSLVSATMLFDTVHQALISHTVYYYVITGFDQPSNLNRLVWSLLVEVIFNGMTALLVQTFLTYRIWKLSNQNRYLTSAVAILVVSEFGCVLAYTCESLGFTSFMELASLQPLSITVNALGAAGDVLIATALCTMLHKSRTGFSQSDTMITKLIMFAVNTGLLTSICAVASLISTLVAPKTFLYIAFFFCIGRLYTNSLLATLNARRSIRDAAEGGGGINSISLHTDLYNTRLQPVSKWYSSAFRHRSRSIIPSARTSPRRNTSPSVSTLQEGKGKSKTNNIAIKIDTTKEFISDASTGSFVGDMDGGSSPASEEGSGLGLGLGSAFQVVDKV